MVRLESCLLKSRGKPRVDDRRVLSGIIFINCNGLRWRNAPKAYGPHKTLYNRWKRWSEKIIFAQMLAGLADEHGEKKTEMIDATYLQAHRTASSLGVKKGRGRGPLIRRAKGGMNTKLHAICESKGWTCNGCVPVFCEDYSP
ncbi:transposase [Donghicola tyrosinivorans]|uniref:Transposase n=1 Tax=Donghicola tyrosinivorans TaxID=1652492 RepID=A0A2T0WWD4_9RHOB|nr:transposase [Donghicola tyrosinivorans]